MTPKTGYDAFLESHCGVVGRQSSLGLHGRHVHFCLYFGKNRGVSVKPQSLGGKYSP
jgi:hypothetical protein